jgi:hypothetical protein
LQEFAQEIGFEANKRLLKVFGLVSYINHFYYDKSSGSFAWEDVYAWLGSNSPNQSVMKEHLGEKYLFNPTLYQVNDLLNSEMTLLRNHYIICSPIRWLGILHFLLVARLGRVKAVMSNCLAWSEKRAQNNSVDASKTPKIQECRRVVEMCTEEIELLEAILEQLPSYDMLLDYI